MKKILTYTLIILLLGSIFVIIPEASDTMKHQENFDVTCSDIIQLDGNNGLRLAIQETELYSSEPGKPRLPVFEKTYYYPINTEINKITVTPNDFSEIHIDDQIELVPIPQPLSDYEISIPTYTFYENPNNYPEKWIDYSIGRGLINGERSIIVKIQLYPVQYYPNENILKKAAELTCEIITTNDESNPQQKTLDEDYSLIILAPSEYKNSLQPLVDHKNNRNISAKMISMDEILSGTYFTVEGDDDQEKIKYFIKNAYDKWETQFVLLVGDKEQVPVRSTYVYLARDDGDDDEIIASDLYYADLYNHKGEFETWDTNNNSRYAEYAWAGNTDILDLYPDVYLGRLVCENTEEVDGVVNKIITYENQESYKKAWFKNIVVIGGDSFPAIYDETSGVDEGEYANQKVLEVMDDFIPEKLWATNAKLAGVNPSGVDRITDATDDGCGFIHFSGHGSDSVWTTYPHNGTRQSLPTPFGSYRADHISDLTNGNLLPIVVTGACSVGKFQSNPDCFSWSYVENPNGGGIASFGATALGYAALGANVTDYVIEKMALEMFKAYKFDEAKTVGEMWATAINNYITPILYGTDFKTIEEWQPFCDPTLALREEYLTPSEPPEKPILEGPKNGNAGETLTYNVTTTDPDRNQVEFLFDWGDGTSSEWLGPVDSGETLSITHSWDSKGSYEVRVKARDENGYESEWSRTLFVTLSKTKVNPFILLIRDLIEMFWENTLFQLFFP